MKDIIYVYIGDGLGIPGLPHQVSKAEAEALGVLELLEEAIKAKKYKKLEVKEATDD